MCVIELSLGKRRINFWADTFETMETDARYSLSNYLKWHGIGLSDPIKKHQKYQSQMTFFPNFELKRYFKSSESTMCYVDSPEFLTDSKEKFLYAMKF